MKVDLKTLSQIIVEIFEAEEVAQDIELCQTPDGRWDLMHKYLERRPRWRAKFTAWVDMSPDQAYGNLTAWISEQGKIPLSFLNMFIPPDVVQRVKHTISIIQNLYLTRAGRPPRKELTQ